MSKRLGSSHLQGLPSPSGGKFWPVTAWELVRTARDGAGAQREDARRELLTLYYKPVFRFFARVLRAHESRVEDVTQEFFARFIEKDFLRAVTHEGSFSAFLKVACRRHYINWCDAERVRRGGANPHVPLDEFGSSIESPLGEDRFASLMDDELRAAYLAEAMEQTKQALLKAGKTDTWGVFEARTRLDTGAAADYASLAKMFGLKVFDVRNRLTAARKIFREALLELAQRRSADARTELAELGLLPYLE